MSDEKKPSTASGAGIGYHVWRQQARQPVRLPENPLASSPAPHVLSIPLPNTINILGGLCLTCKFVVHIQITALGIWGTGICGKEGTDTGLKEGDLEWGPSPHSGAS